MDLIFQLIKAIEQEVEKESIRILQERYQHPDFVNRTTKSVSKTPASGHMARLFELQTDIRKVSDPSNAAGTSNTPTTSTNAASGGTPNGQLPANYPSTCQIQESGNSLAEEAEAALPRYLAICVNTGGIYVTLPEIAVPKSTSDAILFDMMKASYQKLRGFRIRFAFLLRPVGVEFVHFSLWNLLKGYVSICDRPRCVPPESLSDYEFMPRPIVPLPPMPPEVFIHYLQHGDGDLNPIRSIWAPRLPKRLHSPIVNAGMPSYGWGIHIIEGTNRELVFWIIMFTIFASILTTILWSSLKDDAQDESGLGSLIVALPSVLLGAWLFRLGAA
ncbi:uncharacterized protein BDZ99DRAFT_577725 [Mytilinidion resinicola]|uniref:Uncharacterized protein n=1 Tax=Mytilinidion resinicola TaxID=574789 RepID=A0A6A6XXI9_9PEZI|nr:uncharacterized protein BDZ99DRAFT_577725 [Mytilinidion resinicola]KAF2801266.1 hypothetical protein BDZ99DRAFT_577725 [Mytilinidion resinicola]